MRTNLKNYSNNLVWLWALLALLIGLPNYSQANSYSVSHEMESITVTGTVTSTADKLPLIGVSILVKGTTTGTITDVDGAYSINVEEDAILIFSYTGYLTKEVPVNGQTILDVVMEESAVGLEEVVVVGYGTRKKSHNTGAIAQLEGADVAAIQANRVDDALAGKLAGVLIQNQDGEPGADPKIQIRAASSISGDSNPLIVVDGYPISGSLATVNPNDIESIEVLKDAASAAIYGSRGANGGGDTLDFRNSIFPKKHRQKEDGAFKPVHYSQVFEDKNGFIPNLSILDLLFCTGPQAILILENSVVKDNLSHSDK